jgi:hypothetical protein
LGRGARLSGDKAGALEIVKCIKLDIKKGRPTAAESMLKKKLKASRIRLMVLEL